MYSDIAAANHCIVKAPQRDHAENYDANFGSINDDNSRSCCGSTALIMFPTKALAQDQLSKLHTLVKSNATLQRHIRAGIIDGDTPQPQRSVIAKSCNVILTNPDTLHASIVPGWKKYRNLLARVRYVVIDEAHTYDGAFGAHVSLVLSRLVRVCAMAYSSSVFLDDRKRLMPTFIACSATMGRPEEHFRLLCPFPREDTCCVLHPHDDGSPSAREST